MAISVVQSTAKRRLAGGTSQTYSLSGVAAGNALVITITYGAASTNTAQATYPANWIVSSIKSSAGGGRADVAILPGSFITGGAESVALTFPSGTYATGEMHEVSGLDASSPVDLVLTATISSGTTITPTAANHTTAQASEIIFGVAASDPFYASGTDTATQPASYTQLWQETNANSYATGVAAYKVLSAITTVADAWTVPGGSYDYAVAVSFKAATGSSNTATGNASVTPTATGTASAQNSAQGSATLVPTASGTVTQIGTNSAVGNASVQPTASGSAQATLSAQGSASIAPTASGTASQPSGYPVLVAHTIKVDLETLGVSPLTTSPINVPAGATILIQVSSQPTGVLQSISDNSSNTIAQVGTNEGFISNGAASLMYKVENAAANSAYTVSVVKTSGYTTDEMTIMVMVFDNANGVGAFTYDNTGTYTSANPVTTTKPNSAVAAFWNSNDYTGGTNTYGVDSPYALVDTNGNAANSMSGADAYVTEANSGTSTAATFTATNGVSAGGAFWLVEVFAGYGTSNPAVGAATVTPTAKGSATARNVAVGAAALSIAAAGAVLGSLSATGSATVTPTAQGTAQVSQSAQGAATLTPSTSGAAKASQAASGSATVQPAASGAARASQSATGSARITPTAAGSVVFVGTNYAHGLASVLPTASGIAQAYTQAMGSVAITPSAAGQALAFLPAQGSGIVQVSATGSAYASQSAIGSATVQPTASGAVHPPFVGYPADPYFYVLQPPRSFYAAMASRSFYVALPPRSFYVLDNPTMPAQTFPGVMDPAEIKVLTIDGTAELPSGVTLVSIVGSPIITVTQGSDPNVGNVFSGAVINTAPIAAEPPDIPVAIGANLGVQILATNPASGAAYEIRIPCQTSRGATDVVTLKAVITCSSS